MKKSPKSIGKAARRAAVLEVSTEKPGNVTPTKSFKDLEYMDFVKAAEGLEPVVEKAAKQGKKANVGELIYEATKGGKNINFGINMMFIPLAASHGKSTKKILKSLGPEDTKWIVKAMRKAKLGGMELRDKKLSKYDINSKGIFNTIKKEKITPLQLMKMAKPYDTLAREWLGDYPISRVIGRKIEREPESIIHAYLFVLSKYPDTLIARKLGIKEAKKISEMAGFVLKGKINIKSFDEYLRKKGNKRNPGTTADLIATGLFLKLLA